MNDKIKNILVTAISGNWDKEKLSMAKDSALSALLADDEFIIDGLKESTALELAENEVDHGKYEQRLQRIVNRIKGFQEGKYNVTVFVSDEINAHAWPDGTIRVFSALMDILNDDELTAIIGHEMGHVVHHDALKSYRYAVGLEAVKFFIEGAPFPRTAFMTSKVMGPITSNYLNTHYSRKQEYLADEHALKVVSRLGLNPECVATVLEKFVELEHGESFHKIKRLFASHPDSDKRAKRIRKDISKLLNYCSDEEF